MQPSLSADVLSYIFGKLDAASLCRSRMVCKVWNHVGGGPSLWRALYMAATASRRSDLDHVQDWLDMYKKRCEVERAWSHGEERALARLHGHGDFIRCTQLWHNTLVSASGSVRRADCSVRVWDMDTGRCRHVLGGFDGPVWAMMMDGPSQLLATGDSQGGVRLWDIARGRGLDLQGAPSSVHSVCLEGHSGQLVAGCDAGIIMLWSVAELEALAGQDEGGASPSGVRRPLNLLQPPAEHIRLASGAPVTSLQVQSGFCAAATSLRSPDISAWDSSSGRLQPLHWTNPAGRPFARSSSVNSMSFELQLNRLLAGCEDGDLHVFDIERRTLLQTLRGPEPAGISSHQFDEKSAAVATHPGEVKMWDLRSWDCRHTMPHQVPLHTLVYDERRLVTGGWDGSVFIWDLRTGALLDRYYAHEERVWSLAMDDYHVVSAALDHSLVVRSFLPPADRFHGWQGYEVDRAITVEALPAEASIPSGEASHNTTDTADLSEWEGGSSGAASGSGALGGTDSGVGSDADEDVDAFN